MAWEEEIFSVMTIGGEGKSLLTWHHSQFAFLTNIISVCTLKLKFLQGGFLKFRGNLAFSERPSPSFKGYYYEKVASTN